MMKTKDVSIAVALLVNGYLRANDGNEATPNESRHLADCLAAIRREVADWSESLPVPDGKDDNAIEADDIDVEGIMPGGGALNRTPYNLVSVAVAALREAVDLAGPAAVLADFTDRGGLPVVVAADEPKAAR